jgi:NADH-quinone oxidoreductase subunit F
MIVIAEGTCMVHLLQIILRFYHHESCGQCTPCRSRHGLDASHHRPDRRGRRSCRRTSSRLYYISKFNDGTTICGLGDAAGYACSGILDKFRDEFEYFIEHKRSRLDGNLECLKSS